MNTDDVVINYLTKRNALLSQMLGDTAKFLEGFVKAAGEDNPALTKVDGYARALKLCTDIEEILASYEAKGEIKQ